MIGVGAVEVNGPHVRKLREAKGWPQQQLADAAGLSLRTVQRIEKAGNASKESVPCLCASLDVDISEVKVLPAQLDLQKLKTAYHVHPMIILIAMIFGMVIGSVCTVIFFA